MITLAPRDAYQRIALDYDAAPNPMLTLETRTVESLLPPLEGLLVADVAAGTGRWAARGRRDGARTIAIDFSPEMLAYAPRDRVLADILRLPLRDQSIDLVICAFGYGYAPACLPELERITRPSGTVIVSDVHPEGLRRGWRRTFRSGGGVIEPASEPYELEDLRVPGLTQVCVLEATFGEPERAIFEQAGKAAAFAETTLHPAVFAAKWIKA